MSPFRCAGLAVGLLSLMACGSLSVYDIFKTVHSVSFSAETDRADSFLAKTKMSVSVVVSFRPKKKNSFGRSLVSILRIQIDHHLLCIIQF